MAPPSNKKRRGESQKDDALVNELRVQVNNLAASMRLLTAKLDLDAGVTDANFAALITESAIATAPCQIDLIIG